MLRSEEWALVRLDHETSAICPEDYSFLLDGDQRVGSWISHWPADQMLTRLIVNSFHHDPPHGFPGFCQMHDLIGNP